MEPDDEFSQDSLLAALDNKVVLLQDAVALLDQDAPTSRDRIHEQTRIAAAALWLGLLAAAGPACGAGARLGADGRAAKRAAPRRVRSRARSSGTRRLRALPGNASAVCRSPRAQRRALRQGQEVTESVSRTVRIGRDGSLDLAEYRGPRDGDRGQRRRRAHRRGQARVAPERGPGAGAPEGAGGGDHRGRGARRREDPLPAAAVV